MTLRTSPKTALSNIRVLDTTIFGVGNMTTRFLADHGSENIRVESRAHLDLIRSFPPFLDGVPGLNRSVYWAEYNHGRFGATLNLSTPEGVALYKRLVAMSDIVCDNFVCGVMERWGLAYEQLAEVNPSIIMIRLNMQGHTGPAAPHRGAGNTLQALSGFNEVTGWPDGPAVGTGGPYTDFCVPGLAACALLAALDYRTRTGKGQYIDVSQLESAIHFLAPAMLDFEMNGRVAKRAGNTDLEAAPHGVFPAAGEDRWIAISVSNDAEWAGLRSVWNAPIPNESALASSQAARKLSAQQIETALAEWTKGFDAFHLMYRLQAAGVPAGVAQNGADLLRDPQLAHRDQYVKLKHAEIGEHSYEGPSFRLSETPGSPSRAAPVFGEHNDYVFKTLLKLSDEEVDRLVVAKVIY